VVSADPQVLRFRTTAKASADARALAGSGLARGVDLVMDGIGLVAAVLLLVGGYVILGLALAVGVAISVASRRVHPLQRAVIALRLRSILGRTTEVTVDDDGLHFTNPPSSSFVPWSSVTAVRSNAQTVIFLHDGVILGYIPSVAFASPGVQATVESFALSRLAASHT